VEKTVSNNILFSSSSEQIWIDLGQRFGQSDGTKFFLVKRDLYSISQANQDIATYFTHIKKLWDEHDSMMSIPTCSCGLERACYKFVHKMMEKKQLIQLLVGLNDVYKGVRGNILMSRPLPNVSKAYHMLLQEEHQRDMSSSSQIIPSPLPFIPIHKILGLMGNSYVHRNRNVSFNGRNIMNNSGYNSGYNSNSRYNSGYNPSHNLDRGGKPLSKGDNYIAITARS